MNKPYVDLDLFGIQAQNWYNEAAEEYLGLPKGYWIFKLSTLEPAVKTVEQAQQWVSKTVLQKVCQTFNQSDDPMKSFYDFDKRFNSSSTQMWPYICG